MPTYKLDRFLNKAPTLKEDIRDVNNRIDDVGDLQEIRGVTAIIKSILNNLLMVPETYVFDPPLGIGIQRYIFEPADEKTVSLIENRVKEAVKKYEGRAKIETKIVLHYTGKGFTIFFNVFYDGRTKKYTLYINESLLDDNEESIDNYISRNFGEVNA